MTFTKEELDILKQYEEYFFTATKAKYCRYPGKSATETIHRIFVSATKSNVRLNTGCGHCIFTLVRDCGVRYFADKAELEKELADYNPKEVTTNTTIKGKEVELKESVIEDKYEKVSIKTEKKNGKVKKTKTITKK